MAAALLVAAIVAAVLLGLASGAGSPRKEYHNFLAGIGCTNMVIANMIIDAVTWGIPAATVQDRLSSVPNVGRAEIAKVGDPYMKQFSAYLTAKAKAANK